MSQTDTLGIETVINDYFSSITAMNAQDYISIFAEDAISYDPVGEPPTKISEGYQDLIKLLQMSFDKLEAVKEHIFIAVAANEAAVKWTMKGIGKNGKSVSFEGITVFEINDQQKIKTTRAYWNPAAMVAQLRG
jgi:ketosteroid isomerase-like protein